MPQIKLTIEETLLLENKNLKLKILGKEIDSKVAQYKADDEAITKMIQNHCAKVGRSIDDIVDINFNEGVIFLKDISEINKK